MFDTCFGPRVLDRLIRRLTSDRLLPATRNPNRPFEKGSEWDEQAHPTIRTTLHGVRSALMGDGDVVVPVQGRDPPAGHVVVDEVSLS